ncbi:MAG TPA: hypothetical protein VGE07_21740, partial [Herpetosiphonaceae bacterium]
IELTPTITPTNNLARSWRAIELAPASAVAPARSALAKSPQPQRDTEHAGRQLGDAKLQTAWDWHDIEALIASQDWAWHADELAPTLPQVAQERRVSEAINFKS